MARAGRAGYVAIILAGLASSLAAAQPTSFEFLGMAEVAGNPMVDGAPVGGLSGIAWTGAGDEYLALSDDRGERGPVRLYRIEVELDAGRLEKGGVRIREMVALRDRQGDAFPAGSLDPEGIALSSSGIFVSSEGVAKRSIAPFVALFDRTGRKVSDLAIPARYLPDGGKSGVRDNLGFEALTISPDERFVFAGTEDSLAQEGPPAAPGRASLARILRWDLLAGGLAEEFLYRVEGINVTPPTPTDFMVNGLVSMLAIDATNLLTLERQWVPGVGLSVRLYATSLANAAPVARLDPPESLAAESATKRLLLDFSALGIRIDNFEGMAFGPPLADGRRILLVVSDDNFNPDVQRTLFLGFAVGFEGLEIADLQGAGHRSPLEGRWVAGVEGVVTAAESGSRSHGFWMESRIPDGDAATSEGIYVDWEGASTLVPGELVRVGGKVEERGSERNLPMSTLRLISLESLGQGVNLSAPPRLGRDRRVPESVDDDGMARFDVVGDALDFWESLEAMRVEVPAGVVVGPTRSFGEIALLPDGVEAASHSARGGVMLAEAGADLSRIIVGRRLAGSMPDLAVGDRVTRDFAGIVDYGFSNYKVQPLAPLTVESRGNCGATTELAAIPGRLTLATLNLENLSIATGAERMPAFGRAIARELGGPAIVALEEVQDDSGKADDGVVTSRATLDALIAAVVAAGGPRYAAVWIDPENNRDGGQPSGNIRVALLYDPLRAQLVRRGEAGPRDAVEVEGRGRGTRLSFSPGRIAPTSPAFELTSGEGVRKALAAQFRVGRETIFVVANHLSSKWDDDRPFGSRQPPLRPTGAKRLAQAKELRAFAVSLLAADPKAKLVILGDLNEPEWAEGVVLLSQPPLLNLTLELSPEDRYTFNFEGSSQAIDHIIVSPALAASAEIDVVHRNSDCPDSLRVSDHDPVVARLRMR